MMTGCPLIDTHLEYIPTQTTLSLSGQQTEVSLLKAIVKNVSNLGMFQIGIISDGIRIEKQTL